MLTPLKWVGGKRWLISGNKLPNLKDYVNYIEPFVGGGAMFFHLAPGKAILNDLNNDLILFYCVLRDHPLELKVLMDAHQERHNTDYYYHVRSRTCAGKIEQAAKFLYLNRTCWNGLYRVNLKGVFNVPIGTKDTVVFDNDDFDKASKILTNAEITNGDFEETIRRAKKGDLLFVDPPYTVQHNINNFVKYNERLFSWDDQERLHATLNDAKSRGVKIILCNADHESVRDLYSNFGHYVSVKRHSVLAGKSEKRGKTTEALFTSNL